MTSRRDSPLLRGPRSRVVALCLVAVTVLGLGAVGLFSSPGRAESSWAPRPETRGRLRMIAAAEGSRLILKTAGGNRHFLAGVDIGSTIPGHAPGEVATTAADYRRWFPMIASLGLRAVRVYTLLRPAFYNELDAYNRSHPDAPLYLIQGSWIPEEELLATRDMFDPAVHAGMKQELENAMRAVHGDLTLPARPGHASGTWTTDVSRWLYAYAIGIEWDPAATEESDQTNKDRDGYEGDYFETKAAATPAEAWLAEMLDFVASFEAGMGRSVPLTFTNWPTTDPLSHPDEPTTAEDLVAIDANRMRATRAWPAGFFASYHVYPYYPEFLRLEPRFNRYEHRGINDPYAGYLAALKAHHDRAGIPIMITEFGVPSSWSLAHQAPLGRDQGAMTEQMQMRLNADMLRIIHDLDYAGAMVFEWTDEWFKRTWNSMDYEIPDEHRWMWKNMWSPEQNFGLVATEAGNTTTALVDGRCDEWRDNGSVEIFPGDDRIHSVRAAWDEAYLYLSVDLVVDRLWREESIAIGFDVLPGDNGGLPDRPGSHEEADYALVLDGSGAPSAQMYVAGHNDFFSLRYGRDLGYFPVEEADFAPNSGAWHEFRLITLRPLKIPPTGERYPVETFNAGRLRFGTSDPEAVEFDSRASWNAQECIELRLPWMAVGVSDPSDRRAFNVDEDGSTSGVPFGEIEVSVAAGSDHLALTDGVTWDPYVQVSWHERRKAGIATYEAAVRDVQGD